MSQDPRRNKTLKQHYLDIKAAMAKLDVMAASPHTAEAWTDATREMTASVTFFQREILEYYHGREAQTMKPVN